MKKRDLLSFVMISGVATLCAGLLMGACQGGAPNGQNNQRNQGNYMGGDQDTQNFYRQLSPEYQRKFDQLDARSKANAIQMYRDNGSRDANKAVDMASQNQRSKFSGAEKSEKPEVVAIPTENKGTTAAATDAEKGEKKVSSATSTATTTVQ